MNILNYHLIHCKKHIERLSHINNVINKLNVPVNIFDGIYVEKSFSNNKEILDFFKTYDPLFRTCNGLPHETKGAIGCYLSHHLLIKQISENLNSKYSVIFEDDIYLTEQTDNDIKQIILKIEEKNIDFDLCYLRNGSDNHGELIIDNIYKLDKDNYCFQTCALLINNEYIQKIYNSNLDARHEIDTQYARFSNLNILTIYPCLLHINHNLNSNIRPW